MNKYVSIAAALSIFLPDALACAQELTTAEKVEFVRQAQPRYYSPTEHGFASITCDLKLDWDTVPKLMIAPAILGGRDRLESTKLRFTMHRDGKSDITHEYPKDTPSLITPVYDKFFEWTSNVVTGFFTTWGAKSMRTPIPDAHYITGISKDQDAYHLKFVGGVPIEVTLSKDYVISRILTKTPTQTIDEYTKYSASPQGLLLTSDDGVSKTADSTTHVTYDISYQSVGTLEFPQSVHLVVDDNIDMKFSLQNCAVAPVTVITVAPPK